MREKCSNTEFFSGPYFLVFISNTGKHRPEKTPYLNTFYEVNIDSGRPEPYSGPC